MPRRRTIVIALFTMLLMPAVASAQEPEPLLPGEVPETVHGLPFWLGVPMLAAIAGLALLLVLLYVRYSRRFYGREEPPPLRQRPRYAGMAAAQPAAAAPQGAATARPGATAAAQAAGQAPAPPKPEPEAAAPKAPETAEQPSPAEEKPAAEEKAASEPAAEAPAEKPASEQPKPAETPEKPAEQPKPAAGGHVEPDQETFDKVLAEQVDKGVDRRVAEGRARAAAIKAARQKAGG